MRVFSRHYFLPLFAGTALLSLLALWGAYELLGSYKELLEERRDNAAIIGGIVAAGLKTADDATAAEGLLKDFAARTSLKYLRVEQGARVAAASAELPPLPVETGGRPGFVGVHGFSVLRQTIEVNWTGVPESATLVMAWRDKIRPGRMESKGRMLLATLLAGGLGALALVVALSISARSQELRDKLDEERQRREQTEELSLAAAGLAHETKNPLGIIRGLAQRIATGAVAGDEAVHMAREIMDEADVTCARLGDFMCYAKIREPKPEPFNAQERLGRLAAMVSDEFKDAQVTLRLDVDALALAADPEMFSQVLLNLLLNSLKASAPGGVVRISLKADHGRDATLVVADNGSGIDPELLPNIFKPYVTKRGRGNGIGLAIVKKVADQSGWRIAVESAPGKGSVFTISRIRLAV